MHKNASIGMKHEHNGSLIKRGECTLDLQTSHRRDHIAIFNADFVWQKLLLDSVSSGEQQIVAKRRKKK